MKGQEPHPRVLVFATLLALLFSLAGCKLEDPLLPTGPNADDAVSGQSTIGANVTSPSGLTAPIISDPLPGSTLADPQPTLTVLNSAQQGGAPPTYLFQVSASSSFSSLEAQSPQVPEGTDGSTAWQVDRVLPNGAYFWRARARSGTTDSTFSSAAEFTVGSAGTSSAPDPPPPSPPPAPAPPPPSGTSVSDPLIGGSTGDVHGGEFTGGGWRVSSPGNFIRYEVPPMSRGWVQFDTTGLREVNPSPDQFMLFGMWDPSAGDYRTNPYRVHLQKLHPNPHNPPYLRVRWIANGEQHDEGNNFLGWNPNVTYQWRIEWGPDGDANAARVFLDGQLMIEVRYRRTYRPNVHLIELGIGERGESIVGVTYSNLMIGN